MTGEGRVEHLFVRPAARLPCLPRPRVHAVAHRGLDGDHAGKRNLTVLDLDAWDAACEELGRAVDPAARRANVALRGLVLAHSRGRRLRIGEAVLEIVGETRPCELLDDACPGLSRVLRADWRGGVYGTLVIGGAIAVGDRACWLQD